MARERGARRTTVKRRKKVLVFGESDNDTKAIAAFLRGVWPDVDWTIEARRRPPILIKDASPESIPDRVATVAALIDVESVDSDVIAVFAHEDCDAVEPAHLALAQKIEEAFRSRGYEVRAVAPAWEMETWLMQWPDSFPAVVPSWASVERQYAGRNVGLIVNAKEALTRALRPAGRSVRDYRESDAPALAEIVRERGWIRTPRASSGSFDAFVAAADEVLAATGGGSA